MRVIGIGLLTDERVLCLNQVGRRSGAGWFSSVRRDWSEVFHVMLFPPPSGQIPLCCLCWCLQTWFISFDVSIQAAFCFPCSGKGFSYTTMACFRREGVRGGLSIIARRVNAEQVRRFDEWTVLFSPSDTGLTIK